MATLYSATLDTRGNKINFGAYVGLIRGLLKMMEALKSNGAILIYLKYCFIIVLLLYCTYVYVCGELTS